VQAFSVPPSTIDRPRELIKHCGQCAGAPHISGGHSDVATKPRANRCRLAERQQAYNALECTLRILEHVSCAKREHTAKNLAGGRQYCCDEPALDAPYR
jgi:hypothetical protein